MATPSFGSPLSVAVPRADIDAALRECGIRYRRRTFDPATTLYLWAGQIASQDRSCRHAVSRLLAYHAARGDSISAATGGYVQARQRLDIRVIQNLTRVLARRLENRCTEHRPIDRPVFAIDGTGLSSPDTPSIQEVFPQSRLSKPGLGFPLIKGVVLVSVTTGAVLDLAIAPWTGKGTDENSLFRRTWDRLETGDVVVGDRQYSNYWNMSLLSNRGVGSVFRKNERFKLDRLPVKNIFGRFDRVLELQRTSVFPKWVTPGLLRRVPEHIPVRSTLLFTEAIARSSWVELLSTMTDRAVSKADLGQLYRSRWNVELDIRALKVDLGMDILRCQSAEMLQTELWMTALTNNAVRDLMARAADRKGCAPRELSFKGALQTVGAFAPRLDAAAGPRSAELMGQMLDAIGQHVVGNRPDRMEPRANKRRRKPMQPMTVPRDQARREYRERYSD